MTYIQLTNYSPFAPHANFADLTKVLPWLVTLNPKPQTLNQAVNQCCCINRGFMTLGATTDRSPAIVTTYVTGLLHFDHLFDWYPVVLTSCVTVLLPF